MRISFDPVRLVYLVETADGGTYYITERERRTVELKFNALIEKPIENEWAVKVEDSEDNKKLLDAINKELRENKQAERQFKAREVFPATLRQMIDLGNVVMFGPHDQSTGIKGYWASAHAAQAEKFEHKRWANCGHGFTPEEALLNLYEIRNGQGCATDSGVFRLS